MLAKVTHKSLFLSTLFVQAVVKKMHGLQTFQKYEYLAPLQRGLDAGSSIGTGFEVFGVDDPSTLVECLFKSETNTTREYYIKRHYIQLTLTNPFPTPMMCEFTWLRARQSIPVSPTWTDLPTAIYTIVYDQNGQGGQLMPWISPYSGPTLHKWFKIIKTRKRIMKPGKPYFVKLQSSPSTRKRPLQVATEGDTQTYLLMRGQRVLIIRPYGLPSLVAGGNEDYPNNTTLNEWALSLTRRTYTSWYNMDVDFDSNSVDFVPSEMDGRVSAVHTFNPTTFHHSYSRPSVETGQPPYLAPKSHMVSITNTNAPNQDNIPTRGESGDCTVATHNYA